MEEQKFKLFLKPDEFLNRVSTGSTLNKAVKEAIGIIAPKDMSEMVSRHGEVSRSLTILPHTELKDLIRNIPDNKGKEVYSGAMIRTGKISQSLVSNYQTFVQRDKLVGIYLLNKFFSYFDFAGMSSSESCVITSESKQGKYIALYLPPIVEYLPKETLRQPLENLIKRAEHEESIILPSFDGNGTINLKRIISKTREILENPQIQVVQVLRDGTHRAYTTNLAGTTLHMIEINGSMAEAPSVLIDTSDIIITTQKPELRDRFLGLRMEDDKAAERAVGWLNLKYVGIDG